MAKPCSLFVCYSRFDARHCQALSKHLAPLRTEGLVSDWHDGEVAPGSDWDAAIRQQLDAADVIVLLLSADFFASDYVHEVELPLAMERHATGAAVVVPVIVRPVDWKRTLLGRLQALPENGKPVRRWANQDEAWANVAAGIRRVVQASDTKTGSPSTRPLRPSAGTSALPFSRADLVLLRSTLARLYTDRAAVARIASDAGLAPTRIDLQGSAIAMWHAALGEAEKLDQIDAVIHAALAEYPDDLVLNKLANRAACGG